MAKSESIKIELKPSSKKGAVAYGQIVFLNAFAVYITVRESKKGDIFVTFPSYKGKDEEYHDQAFPITAKMRDYITTECGKIVANFENDNDEEF